MRGQHWAGGDVSGTAAVVPPGAKQESCSTSSYAAMVAARICLSVSVLPKEDPGFWFGSGLALKIQLLKRTALQI